MRIWDLPPEQLCRQHLLGEHRELHALWTILTEGKAGYAQHPETRRWRGKLLALYRRHGALVAEMERRHHRHASLIDPRLATGAGVQDEFINTSEEQAAVLRGKGCTCCARLGSDRAPSAPPDKVPRR